MYLDKNAILSSIHNEEVIKICESLGHPEYKTNSQGHLCFSTCLCHGGDSPYKLVYYDDRGDSNKVNGSFHCYTCGESFSITELVIRAKRIQGVNLTWFKALNYIAQETGLLIESNTENVNKDKLATTKDFEYINRLKALKGKKHNAVPELKELNEQVLELFQPYHHEEFLKDGISHEAMNRFEVSYYPYKNQITLPQRDLQGRLVGVRVRNLDFPTDDTPKYCPAVIEGETLSHSTGSVLYGSWVTKDKIKACGKALLVEAEKSCLLAYTYFGEDSYAVAATGSAITLTQQKILMKELGIRELIYAPDWDVKNGYNSYEAEIWWQKILKRVKPFVPFCKVYVIVDNLGLLGYKDSPLDKGLDTFLKLYDNKIEITMSDYLDDVEEVEEE